MNNIRQYIVQNAVGLPTTTFDIITVMFNKFYKKNTKFPSKLRIPSTAGGDINYNVVRSSNIRADSLVGTAGRIVGMDPPPAGVYALNDATVSHGTFEPTPNSYIVFYHNK